MTNQELLLLYLPTAIRDRELRKQSGSHLLCLDSAPAESLPFLPVSAASSVITGKAGSSLTLI